jgi:hypothetical protein
MLFFKYIYNGLREHQINPEGMLIQNFATCGHIIKLELVLKRCRMLRTLQRYNKWATDERIPTEQ